MSFSGLKTALLRARNEKLSSNNTIDGADQADLAASFQRAVADILVEKSKRAMAEYLKDDPKVRSFAVAGGVAANTLIRSELEEMAEKLNTIFVAPPLKYCTDNAAMIAYAGLQRFNAGETDPMDISARPRWPLDTQSPAMLGSGKKGAKA